MNSRLFSSLLLGLVLVGVHADGGGNELLDEARCFGGRLTYRARIALGNAKFACIQSTSTTTTTANPNGDSALSAHQQREIVELYRELSTSNNTAAACRSSPQEAALKLCILTGAGWVQSGLLSQTNILSSFTITSATFIPAVTDCVTSANAVTGDAAAKVTAFFTCWNGKVASSGCQSREEGRWGGRGRGGH
ncbi:unnamed protein product [Darwinula stevensoni]|uniref:Uncharacterized protein n=1 Tax=Darwinula stevensoni TaxID=69355 RepID=A0A7R9FRG1_9CRUS|nr:unnamed protein product [Darwinula stevensoni]CAG0901589.1 unnamed protein product [Darwinula stevensoni]